DYGLGALGSSDAIRIHADLQKRCSPVALSGCRNVGDADVQHRRTDCTTIGHQELVSQVFEVSSAYIQLPTVMLPPSLSLDFSAPSTRKLRPARLVPVAPEYVSPSVGPPAV